MVKTRKIRYLWLDISPKLSLQLNISVGPPSVIYWVVVATQHCRIAFTELDTNLGVNQKYQLFWQFYSFINL